jgi:hypothetical protein
LDRFTPWSTTRRTCPQPFMAHRLNGRSWFRSMDLAIVRALLGASAKAPRFGSMGTSIFLTRSGGFYQALKGALEARPLPTKQLEATE